MSLRRNAAILTATALLALGLGATSAIATPLWTIDLRHQETRFAPGERGLYFVDIDNVGDTDTAGTISVTVKLPSGLTRQDARAVNGDAAASGNGSGFSGVEWSCPGTVGDTSVTCTTTSTVGRHQMARNLLVVADVAPGICGAEPSCERFATARIEGGGASFGDGSACGAPKPPCATTVEPTPIDPVPGGFGLIPASFTPDFFDADGVTPERRASGHPDVFTTPFDVHTGPHPSQAVLAGNPDTKYPPEPLHDLQVDLPPGFVGAPTAVSECPQVLFALAECPLSSQVGRLDLVVSSVLGTPGPKTFQTAITTGVFNLAHPLGYASNLGLNINGIPAHIRVSLDPANRYAITSSVSNIPELYPLFAQKLTLWGTPADPSHDAERCPGFNFFALEIATYPSGLIGGGGTKNECSTDAVPKPFLTMPAQCEDDNTMRLHHYDSWANRGVFGPDVNYTLPGKFTGCEKPRFNPAVSIRPTGTDANTPTGLDVSIKVPQNESPDARSTPPVKRAVVTLPEGMSFSPSFADGLRSCTLAQAKLGTNEPVQCPDSSRIGEVTLSTPLLPQAAEGSMYLGAQGDNPYGSLFALYLVLHDTEGRGILIKIPGRIEVDPVTGQITTLFEDTPQFPFDDLTLKFRSGPRAPLVNPPTCGEHKIAVELASYAQPDKPVDASNFYEITEGPGGTPCPGSASSRPFAPKFSAGTLNPVAGSYSPFLFRLSRDDSEQELTGIKTVLPPGLVAKIAGISTCPEQAIASISTALGAGASEAANPACPASSQIGSISAGLGAGPGPNYFPGKVYLAGPYKGAALSLAVVAPGLAGPFDLGNVVVRAALRVNPETARVTAVSDPFPTILHGVILRARDIRLRVDRPETTINPTSCAKMAVDGEVGGIGGAIFNTASPFQVGSCGDLAFKPKLAFRLFGGTKRGAHPKFRATLTMPPGGANIASASVALPKSEFLDQGHIKTICTRVQFAAEACPAGSVYGTVSAKTPLLDETLSGNIYLRSSSNPLPDLVAAFRGGRIDANIVGRIDSVNGGIRNTFDLVPDVPVTSAVFTFAGGKKGLLVNSRDICNGVFRATAKFAAHNGDALTLRPKLAARCGKSGKAKRRKG